VRRPLDFARGDKTFYIVENLHQVTLLSEVSAKEGKWTWTPGLCFSCTLTEPKEILADCRPEAVINGHSRVLSDKEYQWVSHPDRALPQWIELAFREPAQINSVSIVFDTDMTNPGTCWTAKFPEVSTCVKAYFVEVFDGKEWIRAATEDGNFMRRRTHRFDTVNAQKIRITVLETWGNPSARITEIRAALEE